MRFFWTTLIILLALSGCGGATATPAGAPAQLRPVTLGVGFVPNVQFAPMYVAQQKGFYADEGLEVKIEYGFENDFVALAAQGEREFAMASGDQVILARAQGVPITYVMKWYERYPVALLSGPKHPITNLATDLTGLKIGLPGFFGANYIGWKALAYGAKIDESKVNLVEIGFTQAAAVQQGTVDAALVYIANEPVQLRQQKLNVSVVEVSDYVNLVSNGLVVGEKLRQTDPELVGKMVRATLRGINYTIAHPDEAFEIARKVIPEITDAAAPVQKQVLEASIALWKTDQPGVSSRQAWQDSVDFMQATGLFKGTVKVDDLFTNQFVSAK